MRKSRSIFIGLLAVGILWISSASAQFFPRGIPGRGQNAFQIQPRQYRSHTSLGEAWVEVDPETRSLIIVTDEETNEQIKHLIEEIDRPQPQVLLEVLFLEVTLHDNLDLGVEGLWRFKTHGGKGSIGTQFNLNTITEGGFYEAVADNWEATLRMLAEKGALRVLSRPIILAQNNQEAVMMVGQEIPFVTNSRVTEAGQTINTIQYSEIGIILRVTPFITSNGFVQMIVAPEISTLTDQRIPISETVSSPVIAKRAAETVVVTPNGKTVVIGGLIDNNKTESVKKVPLLGDIPGLGALFRHKVKTNERTELLIFLTPYIISAPEKLVAATKDKMRQVQLAPSAVPNNNLEEFLRSLEPDEQILVNSPTNLTVNPPQR